MEDRSPDSRPPRRLAPAALFIILAALAANAATLNSTPFWLDEILTVIALDGGYADLIRNRIQGGHQPLYFTLAWLWSNVFGISELALRALSWLFIAATVALAWVLGRVTLGRTAAWATALLAALSPHLLYFSHIGRPYALAAPLVLLAILVILEYRRRPRPLALVGIAATTLLLLVTHYSLGAVAGALGLAALLRRRPLWPVVAAQLGVTLVWAPWAWWCVSHYTLEERLHWLDPANAANLLIANANLAFEGVGIERLQSLPLPALIAWTLVSLGVLALCIAGMARLRDAGVFIGFAWSGPILLGVVWLLFREKNLFPNSRYFVSTIVTTPLLLVAGLLWLREAQPRLRHLATLGFVGVAMLSSLFFAKQLLRPTHAAPWRQMAAYLAQHAQPDDRIVAMQYWDAAPLAYYSGRQVDVLVAEPEEVPRAWQMGVQKLTPAEALPTPGAALWIGLDRQRDRELASEPNELGTWEPAFRALRPQLPREEDVDFRDGRLLRLAR